jgi:AcrR family transcriptional regulator
MPENETALPARQKRSSKEAILEAGSYVFAQRGLSGARVEDIVQRSGVNVRMLYHHFGSKEGLYSEVVSRLLNVQTLASERGEFECCVNWLRHQHSKLIRFLSDSPDSLAMLTWELAEQRSGAAENLGAKIIIPMLADPIAAVLNEGMANSTKKPEVLAAMMVHQAAYALRLASAGPIAELKEKTTDQIADELWEQASKEILDLSPHPA